MTTPTTPPNPLQILVASTPVRLTAMLEGEALELRCGGIPLSQHGNRVAIARDSAEPVKVEIHDFEDATGRWTLTASAGSNAWPRGEGLCRAEWNETDGVVTVAVTATNAASGSKTKPIFIDVQPEGARPWP
jgi:hypothetical protein